MQLKSGFKKRLKKHQESLERFKPILKELGFLHFQDYLIRTVGGPQHRNMEQYLNERVINIRYRSDIDAFRNGEVVSFDIKASYLDETGNFSVEFASIYHAIEHEVIIVGEKTPFHFLYLYPEDAKFCWDTIFLPDFSWRWNKHDMQVLRNFAQIHFPTKKVEWIHLVEPDKGSGTPFVLIKASDFSSVLDINRSPKTQTKQSNLGDF